MLAAASSTAAAPVRVGEREVDVRTRSRTKPRAVVLLDVTVNVCGWPISFASFGAIVIRAVAHLLRVAATAGRRVHGRAGRAGDGQPPTGMSDVAETTVVPDTADVIVTVQLAVAAPPV